MSFIQSFSCIINHIRLSIFSLPKDYLDSKITGITHDFKRLFPVRSSHYRCSDQVGFELFEAILTSFIPWKFSILFQKLIKGFRNFRKIFDEPPVEASMAKELSYFFDIYGGW